VQQHREAGAAVAGDHVAAAHHPGQHPGHPLQHQVAGQPPVRLVDRGQSAQLADREHGRLAGAQRGGHPVVELRAAGQAGQRVGVRHRVVAVQVLLVEAGSDRFHVQFAQPLDVRAGQPEGPPVGGVRVRRAAGREQDQRAQPLRLGRAQRHRRHRGAVQQQLDGGRAVRDRQADLAERADVPATLPGAGAGQQLPDVGEAGRQVAGRAQRRQPGGGVAVRAQAAGPDPVQPGRVGARVPAQVGDHVPEHPYAGVGVAVVVVPHGQPDPDRGHHEIGLGQAAADGHPAGPLDRGQRVPVQAHVGIGHGQVVPGAGDLPVHPGHPGQRPRAFHQVGHRAVDRTVEVGDQRGQRVELPEPFGPRGGPDRLRRLVEGAGVLTAAAHVDHRGQAQEQDLRPGVGREAGGQDPLGERQRLAGPPATEQMPELGRPVGGIRHSTTPSADVAQIRGPIIMVCHGLS
jgi:hypothetical protein